ncbi:MAG TPA: HAD family hydrolase [Nevskia sp.]|nr:HAD family hydrolase [Nevskia sp.]
MTAAVFLDKDGTLLENLPYNTAPELIRPAPGAEEALRLLGATDMKLFVVSNQPGVALGHFREEALHDLARWLEAWFRRCGARLEEFTWCPHAPASDGNPVCTCRKPQPGLLLELARRHQLDLARCWMIGDILDDVEAGERAGCRTILLDNGGETEWKPGPLRRPAYRVADLAAAVRLLGTAPPNGIQQAAA